MHSEVIRSPSIPSRFAGHLNELKRRLGPNVAYGDGPKQTYTYSISRPISAFHLLAEGEYEQVRHKLKMNVARCYEPPLEDYSSLLEDSAFNPSQFYRGKKTVDRDTSLGFWCPLLPDKNPGSRSSSDSEYEAHVFLCPDRIINLAKSLEGNLNDIPKRSFEKAVFEAVALHEIGHHYMLANQPYHVVERLSRVEMDGIADSRISEGLANTFAYLMGGSHARMALCQIALNQGLSYRLFLFLKHADISTLLDCFSKPDNYAKAPWALGHVFGGKHNLNGFGIYVNGRFDGTAFDWSDKGGRIVAKDGIRTLTTMLDGCFIAPRIDLLVGRFPPNSLIVTNEIGNAPDYGQFPANIIVLPRERVDLRRIISARVEWKEVDQRVPLILADAGVDERWVTQFRPRYKEIEDDIAKMERQIHDSNY